MPFFEKYKLRVFTLILFFIAASVSSFAEGDSGLDVFDHSDPLYASFQQPDTAALPKATLPAAPAKRGFFTRLGHAYLDDWTVDSNGAPAAPEPARRGTPRPLNSPPFPSADWPIGGTVVIGAPDYNTYILMQAINENKSRIKIYGWIDIGGTPAPLTKAGMPTTRPPMTSYRTRSSSTRRRSISSDFQIPCKQIISIGGSGSRVSTAWITATRQLKVSSASSCSSTIMNTATTR